MLRFARDKARANCGNKLAKNTAFLYVLSFSSQIVNLALIPFETRVLGSSAYGVIALAVSMSSIMVIVLDFGFILSATEAVVERRNDPRALSRLMSDVLLAKGCLSLLAFSIVGALVLGCEPFSTYPLLFLLYCAAYVVNAFLPDFLYRGLEDMRAITVRSVVIKVVFSLPIFVLLRSTDDIWVIPLCLLLGNLSAAAFSYIDVRKRYEVELCPPNPKGSFALVGESAPFFVSRFASTFYQSMNAVMLGVMYPNGAVVGQYGASEKFLSYTKAVSSPVADSLYPYMVRTGNYRLCVRLLLFSAPVIAVCVIIAWVFAEQICLFVFGPGYEESAVLLRCLLPAIAVIFPTYILCFPMLVPMGLSDYANRSNVVGAVVQVTLIVFLFAFELLDARTLCLAASVSEVSVFLFRLWAVISHRDRMRRLSKPDSKGLVNE